VVVALALSFPLAAVALVVTGIAWFYSEPWCGQTFTWSRRAAWLVPALMIAICLAAVPALLILGVAHRTARHYAAIVVCTAVVMALPLQIASARLDHGTEVSDQMCGLGDH